MTDQILEERRLKDTDSHNSGRPSAGTVFLDKEPAAGRELSVIASSVAHAAGIGFSSGIGFSWFANGAANDILNKKEKAMTDDYKSILGEGVEKWINGVNGAISGFTTLPYKPDPTKPIAGQIPNYIPGTADFELLAAKIGSAVDWAVTANPVNIAPSAIPSSDGVREK
jgi:hypothetical protein